MKGRFLISSNLKPKDSNIYADKSALVIFWLLSKGAKKPSFSIRQVSKETKISLGLVQRIFQNLHKVGLLEAKGIGTAKTFSMKSPKLLMQSWIESYKIMERCTMRTYSSSYTSREELIEALEKSDVNSKVVLTLHSAAAALGIKNNNLQTLELYMLDPSIESKLKELLDLEPQERGYEVLLITPYYRSILAHLSVKKESLSISNPILTFLDLYHFPLRGLEQAEFMAKRLAELKTLY